ncbi:MAG: tetratricopeptide repeat protein [Planctomycetota bacterium]|nr:MAG: tetratricopeptide repeat protein [Planctomycetota bacterium]
MARKRLNKKVALVGSGFFVLVVLVVIAFILYLSRDPEKFIKDGDLAITAAREATDEEVKTEEYKRAERSYHKARSLAKTDSLRVEILFKLAGLYLETEQWRNVVGCWNAIIRIDPQNIKARFGRLKYLYSMADSFTMAGGGGGGIWQEIELQASEFIDIAEGANLLAEDTTKWESFEIKEREPAPQRIGSYMYLLRGRALFELAKLGAVTDPEASLSNAINDLEKARELELTQPQIYWYIAQAYLTRGEILASRGSLEERDKAKEQAEQLLEQAVEVTGEDVRAYTNLLAMKRGLLETSAATPIQEQIASLEPEYLSLVEKFDSSAEAHSALAGFYMRLGPKSLEQAIDAIEKAIELDEQNVGYIRAAANLYYRKFSVYGQKPFLYKAIEIAKHALTLPDAQDNPGPQRLISRANRISLYSFLANSCIEQVLEPCEVRTEAQTKEWLTHAEQAVYEIEQLVGSGEDPQVIRWRGMLELARGDRTLAIKSLYAAYEQLTAAGGRNEMLSYTLAKLFENTTELGAASEFFASALRRPGGIDDRKPEALLDYADVMLKLRYYRRAFNVVNFFEDQYWPNDRSHMLRIKALIGAGQFDQAEEELNKRQPNDPNTIEFNLELAQAKIGQLERYIEQKNMQKTVTAIFRQASDIEKESLEPQIAELKNYKSLRAQLAGKLLAVEPSSVDEDTISAVCDNYIAEGDIEQAKNLVGQCIDIFPDNTTILFYKRILHEPQPDKISQQKRSEIQQQVLLNIADPRAKAMKLGLFYLKNNELNRAAVEFKKVLEMEPLQEENIAKPAPYESNETTDSRRLAAGYLSDIALEMKDSNLAEEIVELAQRDDLDGCEGRFFAAVVAFTKQEYEDALTNLEQCLKQRPIFSPALLLRSKTHAALGNEHASVADAQVSLSLNPLDPTIAKGLWSVLYQRNQKLGDNVSSDQLIETRAALDRAVARNPDDLDLLSDYAEYIFSKEPLRALAIRQKLQTIAPSVQNSVLLGRQATRIALGVADSQRKEALFDIAQSSFEQAKEMDQQSEEMLYNYSEYYRVRGQEKQAEQLLLDSQNPNLLWRYYFRTGRLEDAENVLQQTYKAQPEDEDMVRGLLLLAEETADQETVKKYSEELLSLDENIESYLIQIQTFLRVGLLKEAEYKLQSFKEKFPAEPRALLLEAMLAMKQGRVKEALELTNRSLETGQDNPVAWRLRGEINFLMADYAQAIIDLNRSKALSDEPVTRISLARAYLRAARSEDAITELKSAIERPQASTQATELLERVYLQLGRTEALKSFYDENLTKFPDSVYWYNRAGAFAIAEGRFGRAEQLYAQAWQKGKDSGGDDAEAALDGYLRALLLNGKLDKVFEEARGFVDTDFASIAYLRMAEAKLKLGDEENAMQYSRKALDKAFAETNDILVTDILQRMYSLLGAQKVLQICKEKLEANSNSFAANFAMFDLMRINGEYNKAIDYLDKCLQIIGPDSPHITDYIMKKTMVLYLAYGKTSDNSYLERAIAEYESLLDKLPNNTSVLNNLAYMLAEANVQVETALEYARRAYQAMPNNPGFLDTYAYALYKNRRFLEAEQFLRSALQQFEAQRIRIPPEVYEHLALIKEELGATAEAIDAYNQALEAGGDELSQPVKQRINSAIDRLLQQSEK